MTEPSISAARGILQNADRALAQLETQLEQVKAAVDQANRERDRLAAEMAEHENHLAELTAKHQSECDARKREISNLENAVIIREREAKAALERAAARELAAERRSLDLNQRIHSVGTI